MVIDLGAGPEIDLPGRGEPARIGKERAVELVERAPEVIGMEMGEQHMRHRIGLDSSRLKAFSELAGASQEVRARAAIEQDDVLAALQAGDVEDRARRPGLLRLGSELRRRDIARQHRQR